MSFVRVTKQRWSIRPSVQVKEKRGHRTEREREREGRTFYCVVKHLSVLRPPRPAVVGMVRPLSPPMTPPTASSSAPSSPRSASLSLLPIAWSIQFSSVKYLIKFPERPTSHEWTRTTETSGRGRGQREGGVSTFSVGRSVGRNVRVLFPSSHHPSVRAFLGCGGAMIDAFCYTLIIPAEE